MSDGESAQSQSKPVPAGAIGDAPAAFGNALLAAAKALGTQPAGDPRATAAVQLGWVMGSLVTPGAQTPLPSGYPIDAATVFKAKAIELPTLLTRVKVEVRPPADALLAALQTGASAIAEALSWESSLVAALLGADVHLAKAYGVGRALNLLAYTTPVDLQAKELTGIADVLDDLSTALPPHAGRSVGNSIRAWQRAHTPPGPEVLSAQCELWRIVLTGEKRATELLEPENYIDAAENLAVKLRATATVLLRQYALWVVVDRRPVDWRRDRAAVRTRDGEPDRRGTLECARRPGADLEGGGDDAGQTGWAARGSAVGSRARRSSDRGDHAGGAAPSQVQAARAPSAHRR